MLLRDGVEEGEFHLERKSLGLSLFCVAGAGAGFYFSSSHIALEGEVVGGEREQQREKVKTRERE